MSLKIYNMSNSAWEYPGCLATIQYRVTSSDFSTDTGSFLMATNCNNDINEAMARETFLSAMQQGFNTGLNGERLFKDSEIEVFLNTGVMHFNSNTTTKWAAHVWADTTRVYWEMHHPSRVRRLKERYPGFTMLAYWATAHVSTGEGISLALSCPYGDETFFNYMSFERMVAIMSVQTRRDAVAHLDGLLSGSYNIVSAVAAELTPAAVIADTINARADTAGIDLVHLHLKAMQAAINLNKQSAIQEHLYEN